MFRMTVQVHVEGIWRRKCVSTVGWFEGVQPIGATEGRKKGREGDRIVTGPWDLRFLEDLNHDL